MSGRLGFRARWYTTDDQKASHCEKGQAARTEHHEPVHSMEVFLHLNGRELVGTLEEQERLMLDLADGHITREQLTAYSPQECCRVTRSARTQRLVDQPRWLVTAIHIASLQPPARRLQREGTLRRADLTVSEPVGAIQFRQIPVECAERRMTGLPCNRQHEAVRESECWSAPDILNRCGDGIGVLQGYMQMIQQHVHRGRDLSRATFIDRREHPRGFGEHEMRHPRAAFDTLLSRCNLLRVVACQQANQNVRVNGPHGASSCAGARLPSDPRAS